MRPRPSSDDGPAIELQTPRRLADQLESFARDLSARSIALLTLRHYLPDTVLGREYESLRSLAERVADVSVSVRVGAIPVTRHGAEGFTPERPLLDAIEHAPAPAPEPPPPVSMCELLHPPVNKNGRARNRKKRAVNIPEPEPEPGHNPDDWRAVRVEALTDLDAPHFLALAGREIDTLGELADFLGEDGFRGLTFADDARLEFREAYKVIAALHLWWLDNRTDPIPFRDEGDCPADRTRTELLRDWLKRRRAGDTAPLWDRWSEFEAALEDGSPVRVVYDPGRLPGGGPDRFLSGHLDLYGPMSETGYYSHFIRLDDAESMPLDRYAEQFARKLAAETAKERANQERRKKREAKSKAKAEQPEHFEVRPVVSDVLPPTKQFMVYHGPLGGIIRRVCLVHAQSLEEAVIEAEERIGWQVHNFPEGLTIQSPDEPASFRLSAERDWLDSPVREEHAGESVRDGARDQVPEAPPEGTPRVYEVVYHGPDGNAVVNDFKAVSKSDAEALRDRWLDEHRPTAARFRYEVRPAKPEKAARRRAKADREARRFHAQFERESRDRQREVESDVPDPETVEAAS